MTLFVLNYPMWPNPSAVLSIGCRCHCQFHEYKFVSANTALSSVSIGEVYRDNPSDNKSHTATVKWLLAMATLGGTTEIGSFLFLSRPRLVHSLSLSPRLSPKKCCQYTWASTKRYDQMNTKGGSITVLLTSCLTGLESTVWQQTFFVFICKTD
jgi:hypothetical protein